MDDREKDKTHIIVTTPGAGQTHQMVSLDVVKSAFIAEGLGAKEIAERYHLSESVVEKLIDDHKLVELRKAYIREGISKLQNKQLDQAQKLMDLELNFKKLRLVQLEKQLEDYLAYYARHGDFYKRHPVSGDILVDSDGIKMQLHVPNVAREIAQIRESVGLSEGTKKLLTTIDDIINGKNKDKSADDGEILDFDNVEDLFKKKV